VELDFSAAIGGKPVKGTSALGYHAELGSGRLLEEIERGVLGMSPGERKEIEVDFPSDYPNNAFKGKTVVFDVHLRGLQERDVRPLDDAFAKDASEFDDLNALRADVAETLTGRLQREADAAYRSEVLTALGRAVEVDLPEELIADKTDELLLSLDRGFARRGVSLAAWLRQTGKTPDDARAELRDEAVDTLKKEIALEAFADREGITVGDEQLHDLVLEDANDAGLDDAESMVQEVLSSSSKESVREDVRLRLALDRAVEIATPISLEQAEAREKLWTPEKDESEKPKPQLWTPGQPR
jgi:trigger factor